MGKDALIKVAMYVLTQVLRQLDGERVGKWLGNGVEKLIELAESSDNKIDDLLIPMLEDIKEKLKNE